MSTYKKKNPSDEAAAPPEGPEAIARPPEAALQAQLAADTERVLDAMAAAEKTAAHATENMLTAVQTLQEGPVNNNTIVDFIRRVGAVVAAAQAARRELLALPNQMLIHQTQPRVRLAAEGVRLAVLAAEGAAAQAREMVPSLPDEIYIALQLAMATTNPARNDIAALFRRLRREQGEEEEEEEEEEQQNPAARLDSRFFELLRSVIAPAKPGEKADGSSTQPIPLQNKITPEAAQPSINPAVKAAAEAAAKKRDPDSDSDSNPDSSPSP